jgi:thiol-disulfide isomerase/thioredoxin
VPITDAEGADVTWARFAGRVAVVNFWATWCAPCVKEMPALLRLQQARPDVAVLALSQDRGGRAVVEPFYRAHGLMGGLGLWFDPRSRLGRAIEVRGLPTTILVDPLGREVARLEGAADWDSAAALAAVDAVA